MKTKTMMKTQSSLLAMSLVAMIASATTAQDAKDDLPDPGKFAPIA